MARAHSLGGALAAEHAERCALLLGVSLPVAPEDLKAAYRAKAKQHHPDAGGDAHTFRAVKDAYDFIIGGGALGVTTSGKAQARPSQTIQGDLLSELGKGLGPRINGKTCSQCRGLGYRTERGWRGHGGDDNGVLHMTCSHCSGTGEVEMFNPVLPKRRLARTKQGSKPPEEATRAVGDVDTDQRGRESVHSRGRRSASGGPRAVSAHSLTDKQLLGIYARMTDDTVVDDDSRREWILAELRQIVAAPDSLVAGAVIEWWGNWGEPGWNCSPRAWAAEYRRRAARAAKRAERLLP